MKYKNIAIFGLGSGLYTYHYFSKKSVNVVAWDDNLEIRTKYANEINFQPLNTWNFEELDVIIVSPGIALYYPIEHFLVQKAKEHNVKICCDVEIFYELYPNKTYIAVTGTNGKSTVASLIYTIFVANGKRAALLGNIGIPVFAFDVTECEYIILELSSFQLSLMANFKFHCALFLNLAIDHLAYHGTFANYVAAKEKIFQNQDQQDVAIINKSLPKEMVAHLVKQQIVVIGEQLVIKNNKLIDSSLPNKKDVMDFTKIQHLKGLHNQENIAFAFACAKFFALNAENTIRAINNFHALPHRQAVVRVLRHITFIDDSKATSPESTLVALENFNNIILILGGVKKRDELDILIPSLHKKVIHTFLIGSSTKVFAKIFKANNLPYSASPDLAVAVSAAYDLANSYSKPITVLLSPACASYDMFPNFAVRGQVFAKLVHLLTL